MVHTNIIDSRVGSNAFSSDTAMLLVASHSGLFLVELDENLSIVNSEKIRSGYHYGISNPSFQNSGFKLFSYRGGDDVLLQTEKTVNEYVYTHGKFDLNKSYSLGDEIGEVHQIERTDKQEFSDSLYIANTANNSVEFWSPELGLIDKFHVNGAKSDVNHLNSIYVDGKDIAIMLHNRRRMESQILLCLLYTSPSPRDS